MYDKAGSVLRLEMVINEPEGFKVRKQVLRHLIDTDLYVYSRGWKGETPRFYPLRAPDDPDVAAVAETVSRRTQALWRKKGIGASDDGEAENLLMRDTPWLAELYAHGVRGASPRGRTPGNATEPGVPAENPKSRTHPLGVAPMSMGSAFMRM